MRILGVGDDGDLGDMYSRLHHAGHEVRMYIGSEDARSIYEGIVPKSDDWEKDLPWVRAARSDGVVVFESAARRRIRSGAKATTSSVGARTATDSRRTGASARMRSADWI